MNKIILTMLFFISYVTYAADNEGDRDIADLDEIIIDEESIGPQYRQVNHLPGSADDLAQQLTAICYGKQRNDKFCVTAFEQELKILKKRDYQQYARITELIQTQFYNRRNNAPQRGILAPTDSIPIELLQFAFKAWKKERALQNQTIQQHSGTLAENDETIRSLRTYGTWKNRGLLGSIVVILLQTGGYFLYTYLDNSC